MSLMFDGDWELGSEGERAILEMVMIEKSYRSGTNERHGLPRWRFATGDVLGEFGLPRSWVRAAAVSRLLAKRSRGLLPPDRGEVRVAGQQLDKLRGSALHSLRRRAIGYVFQDYNLMRTLTAAEKCGTARVSSPVYAAPTRSDRPSPRWPPSGWPSRRIGSRTSPAAVSSSGWHRGQGDRLANAGLSVADEPTGAPSTPPPQRPCWTCCCIW